MRLNPSRLVSLVLCVAVIGLVGFSLTSPKGADAANRKGVKAPEIAITDGINGATAKTKISDFKGSPTLVVIWLPVCPHCKRFMPTVPAMQKKYGKKGLKIMTVTHGKKEWTAKYLRDNKWNFPVGFDWTGVTAKRYGMKGMPGVYLIGADGYLRSYTGSLDAAIAEELRPAKK